MGRLHIPVSSADHSLGPEGASITVVEYGDYQCSECAASHRRLAPFTDVHLRESRFVFRHFPMARIHEYALLGALAAEAASLQNKFWPMHHLLLENQSMLGPDGIFQFAEWLGLDLEQFQSDLENDDLKKKIHGDFVGGIQSGITSTPTFFLNGQMREGEIDTLLFGTDAMIGVGEASPSCFERPSATRDA